VSLFAREPGPARALRARVPVPRTPSSTRLDLLPPMVAPPTLVRLEYPAATEPRAMRAISPSAFAGVGSVGSRPVVADATSLIVKLAASSACSVALSNEPVRPAHRPAGHHSRGQAQATLAVAGADPADAPAKGPSLRDRLRAVLAPPVRALLPRVGSVLQWPASLHPFQLDGVRVLLSKCEVLLADDMGLGKTVQAIAALRILLHRGEAESVLIVVPASLVHQWRHELLRWAPELRVSTVVGTRERRASAWSFEAHVFLVTYETLRSDFSLHPSSWPRRRTWGLVILDEAQKIKNRDTDASATCKMVPRQRSWALTGTPLENSVDDLASILEFLQPNPGGEPVRPLHFDAALRERHRHVQLRRRKADVLTELPPKTVNRVLLDLSEEQMRTYRRAEEEGVIELRARGETIQLTHVLQLITRLKQICNFCPETGASAKLTDLLGRLEVLSAEGHKALVFSQYTDDVFGVRAIEKGIRQFAPLIYTGDLPQDERSRRMASFKSDPTHRALILSLRAGGQGLNLQDASYVIHFDRWWNPAIERQAEDRSHRMGQTAPVTVYTYTCVGTIEDRIQQLLEEKQKLFDLVVDDVSLDLDRVLTAQDIFGLFGLRSSRHVAKPAGGAQRFDEMTGREFEEYVAGLFRTLGFAVDLTPASRDGGVDVVARQMDVVGIESSLYIQCKNHVSPVGVETVRALLGSLPGGEPGARAVLICPSGFSADAVRLANDRRVQLVDERVLRSLANQI
jgi:superfamily II DNA or RNA helicase